MVTCRIPMWRRSMNDPAPTRQRVDKWLWFARIVKSRTLAAKLVSEGRIRVNSVRIATPAKPVGPGDVLTIALEREVKVLRIVANAEHRGPYPGARLLYDDLSGRAGPDGTAKRL
jgi:ribosome-associated heat shock protein Hsp15